MMDERGVCKLVDFGMTTRLGPPSPSSASMLLLGKPSYVSPEVAAHRRMGLDSPDPHPQGLYSHLICGGEVGVGGAVGGGHCERGGGAAVELKHEVPPVTRPFSKDDSHNRASGVWALGEGAAIAKGGGGEAGGGRPIAPPHAPQNHVDPCARDMWALGVFMFILLLGCPIYADPGDPAFALLCASPSEEVSAPQKSLALHVMWNER